MSTQLAEHALFTQKPVGKQAEFHASQADSRWIIAGNQSGKTTAGARESDFFATGLHPFREVKAPTIGWVITLDRLFAQDVLLPSIMQFLPENLIAKISKGDVLRILLTNGSQIVFRTYGQGWQKFQGAKIDWAWFDEECPEDVYDETMVRLMAKKGPHWVTMTPLRGKSWVHSKVVVPYQDGALAKDDTEIFNWSTSDNTSLDQARVNRTFGKMNVGIRQARMSGDFVDLEGLIWPDFEDEIHVVDDFPLQPNWPVTVGMDYGYRHPFAAVFIAVDEEGRKIVFKTYRRAEALIAHHARSILEIFLEYAPHLIDVKVVEHVLQQIKDGKVPDERPSIRAHFVIDASAQQCRREFIPYGISADNCDRDINSRIERVGQLLLDTKEGRPGLVIMRGRNGPLVDEMRGYSWAKKRPGSTEEAAAKPEPQQVRDDACDGLGYGVLACHEKAPKESTQEPEFSPAWLRRMRGRADRVSRKMGNERIPPEVIHAQMLRRGRYW